MALTTILKEQTISNFSVGETGIEGCLPLVIGETYKVMWDGVEYSCVATSGEAFGEAGSVLLGNGVVVGASGNGEPFAIVTLPETGYTLMAATLADGSVDTSVDTHTVAIYQGTADEGGEDDGTEEEQEGIVLINRDGEKVPYYGIETVTFDTTTEGKRQTYSKGVKAEKSVALSLADGNQIVEPDEGTVISKVTIEKPETLLPENIRRGVEVAGVTGEMIGDTEEATVELALADGDQVVMPSADGKVLSKVTITKPETLLPENIAEGIDIAGIIGTLAAGGGGGSAKVAYGKWTGSYTGGTITHNLGVVPDLIFVWIYTGTSYSTLKTYNAFRWGMSTDFAAVMGMTIPQGGIAGSGSYYRISVTAFDNTKGIEEKENFTGFEAIQSADETTFTLASNYLTSGNYAWVAIGGLT